MHYISVIMSVYNEREDWIRKAIESILNQTYSHFEFIIVLDKPDNDKLRKLIQKYAEEDNRIHFVENQKNYGLIYSLNRAINLAKGNFIARMDADDISRTDRFEKQIKVLEKTGYDIVASAMQFVDEEGNCLGISSSYGRTPEKCLKSLIYRAVLPHPTWMFRRNIIQDIGMYNHVETAEDYDFMCRAVSGGKKAINMSEVLLNYRLRNTGISIGKAYQQNKTMSIIQKEYRKCVHIKKKYDSKSVIEKTARINYTKKHLFYTATSNLYKDGCNLVKSRNVMGFFKLFIGITFNLSNFRHFIYTARLKSINK